MSGEEITLISNKKEAMLLSAEAAYFGSSRGKRERTAPARFDPIKEGASDVARRRGSLESSVSSLSATAAQNESAVSSSPKRKRGRPSKKDLEARGRIRDNKKSKRVGRKPKPSSAASVTISEDSSSIISATATTIHQLKPDDIVLTRYGIDTYKDRESNKAFEKLIAENLEMFEFASRRDKPKVCALVLQQLQGKRLLKRKDDESLVLLEQEDEQIEWIKLAFAEYRWALDNPSSSSSEEGEEEEEEMDGAASPSKARPPPAKHTPSKQKEKVSRAISKQKEVNTSSADEAIEDAENTTILAPSIYDAAKSRRKRSQRALYDPLKEGASDVQRRKEAATSGKAKKEKASAVLSESKPKPRGKVGRPPKAKTTATTTTTVVASETAAASKTAIMEASYTGSGRRRSAPKLYDPLQDGASDVARRRDSSTGTISEDSNSLSNKPGKEPSRKRKNRDDDDVRSKASDPKAPQPKAAKRGRKPGKKASPRKINDSSSSGGSADPSSAITMDGLFSFSKRQRSQPKLFDPLEEGASDVQRRKNDKKPTTSKSVSKNMEQPTTTKELTKMKQTSSHVVKKSSDKKIQPKVVSKKSASKPTKPSSKKLISKAAPSLPQPASSIGLDFLAQIALGSHLETPVESEVSDSSTDEPQPPPPPPPVPVKKPVTASSTTSTKPKEPRAPAISPRPPYYGITDKTEPLFEKIRFLQEGKSEKARAAMMGLCRSQELADVLVEVYTVVEGSKTELLPSGLSAYGCIPKSWILLCLQESLIQSSGIDQLEKTCMELESLTIVKSFLLKTGLMVNFPDVALKDAAIPYTARYRTECLHCELFIARVISALEFISANNMPPMLRAKIEDCLNLMNTYTPKARGAAAGGAGALSRVVPATPFRPAPVLLEPSTRPAEAAFGTVLPVSKEVTTKGPEAAAMLVSKECEPPPQEEDQEVDTATKDAVVPPKKRFLLHHSKRVVSTDKMSLADDDIAEETAAATMKQQDSSTASSISAMLALAGGAGARTQ